MTLHPNPLFSIQDLTLHFPLTRGLADLVLRQPAREVRALNGINLEISQGETLGIVGESGCGKSTLARCLVRLLDPTSGTIRFQDQNIANFKGTERQTYNRQVQMIFQDPYSSLNPRMTVGQILDEALRVHEMRPETERPARIAELLDLVRLPRNAAEKLPHEFSGGQRQRIGIARALAVEPICLVADELVSALDVSVQAQVVNLLLELQEELGLTVLFVAHDLRLVRHVSHQVAVIYLGSIVEIGPSETLFRAPTHPYSQALLSAAPSLNPEERHDKPAISGELPSPLNVPAGCPFHVRCPLATARCTSEKPLLKPLPGGGQAACHHAETSVGERKQ
ncbi:ABC transporter ATP-binding protein [Aestuariispira insulae]|uniref:Oligopeptide transport system ATP-binding protein n=1 Tax=Aestuariispira insulae TaxID=1461337 RepID=A0A3D9HT10_9PROT|nr:oligopeptide/dipeptide ABC transporter ATP-binding protein [Aestuariispira insulae]RED52555.1 oligopeptide transport system ATP-binding protein [Aestuariispira insulae]